MNKELILVDINITEETAGILFALNRLNHVDEKEIKEIIKKTKRMSAKELAEFAYTTEVLNIDFVYGNPESEDNYNLFKDTVTDFYNKKYRKKR